MDQQPNQEPLVVPAAEGQAYPPYQGQPDPEKQIPPPEGAYPPQQQGYPQQQAYPPQGYPQQQPPGYPQQQPPAYPQQQGYSQPPPPGYQAYPQGYPPQTTSTTAVIVTQPSTTTYVQPTQRRKNEAIPTIGLICTIIHLVICLSFGNLLIFACLIPALICAIVGLTTTDNEQSAKTCGWLAIGTNIATIVFYVVCVIAVIIGLIVAFI